VASTDGITYTGTKNWMSRLSDKDLLS